MYKCVCFAVSEDDIKELIKAGYSEPLACAALKVGQCCGICLEEENEKARNESTDSQV